MTLRILLTFSLLLILSAKGSEIRNSPSTLHWLRSLDPETDCKGPIAPGIAMADPDDCMKFYVCDGDGGYQGPFPCGDDMKCFDPVEHVCTDDTATCNSICITIGPQCKSECTAALDHIFDPDDCTKHSICLDATGNNVFDAYCHTDTPYFNGKECVSDQVQCCKCRVPTCAPDDGGKQFADPEDCHSYYLCVTFGSGPTALKLPCEDGGSFVNGKCDPNTKECTNDCDIGGDVTSTTSDVTGTTTTTTITTPTTTTTSGCTDLSDFTCPGNGFYARCTYCDPSYFKCNGVAATPTQGACSGDLVFNPNPQFPYCVRPENCPYNP